MHALIHIQKVTRSTKLNFRNDCEKECIYRFGSREMKTAMDVDSQFSVHNQKVQSLLAQQQHEISEINPI